MPSLNLQKMDSEIERQMKIEADVLADRGSGEWGQHNLISGSWKLLFKKRKCFIYVIFIDSILICFS